VELVMRVSRGQDNRLTGTVRAARDADAREFSGTLELMRVFEELVPIERAGRQPDTREATVNFAVRRPAGPKGR
jgi:hypothetical protein